MTTPNSDLIPKKLAAIEAHKRLRIAFYTALMGIGGSVIPIFFYTAERWAGAACAAIFAGVLGMIAVRTIKEMKQLERGYNLNPNIRVTVASPEEETKT